MSTLKTWHKGRTWDKDQKLCKCIDIPNYDKTHNRLFKIYDLYKYSKTRIDSKNPYTFYFITDLNGKFIQNLIEDFDKYFIDIEEDRDQKLEKLLEEDEKDL